MDVTKDGRADMVPDKDKWLVLVNTMRFRVAQNSGDFLAS
jgi:hypothetical protein